MVTVFAEALKNWCEDNLWNPSSTPIGTHYERGLLTGSPPSEDDGINEIQNQKSPIENFLSPYLHQLHTPRVASNNLAFASEKFSEEFQNLGICFSLFRFRFDLNLYRVFLVIKNFIDLVLVCVRRNFCPKKRHALYF